MRRRLYLVSGFAILALGVLGAVAWVGFTIKHAVNAVEGFQSLSLPTETVVQLEDKHYVLYYESPAAYTLASEAPRMEVIVAEDPSGRRLATPPYTTSLTYSSGGEHGVAEYTVDPPHKGAYVVSAGSEVPGGQLVIGESIATIGLHAVLRGLIALLIFFGVGGIGVALLSVYDRKSSKSEEPSEDGTSDTESGGHALSNL